MNYWYDNPTSFGPLDESWTLVLLLLCCREKPRLNSMDLDCLVLSFVYVWLWELSDFFYLEFFYLVMRWSRRLTWLIWGRENEITSGEMMKEAALLAWTEFTGVTITTPKKSDEGENIIWHNILNDSHLLINELLRSEISN